MSQILTSKLSSVRRKNTLVATATGLIAAVGAAVLGLAISMLIDYFTPGGGLSIAWRTALLALIVAAVVWIVIYAVFGPIVYGPDDDEIALMVEDSEPAFRTRLIASVQLSRPNSVPAGASQTLVNAMIAQAESLSQPMDFSRVIKTDNLIKVTVISLLILIAGGAAFAWGGQSAKDLLKRAFLSTTTAVPRATRVMSITDNLRIAKGDSIELLVMADGTVPENGVVYIKLLDSGRKQEFKLDKTPIDTLRLKQLKQVVANSNREKQELDPIARKLEIDGEQAPVFGINIENVQENFTYSVRLNDGDSLRTYRVEVMPRPAVVKVDVKQVFPEYTKLAPQTRGLGDLAILQGSKLQISITANKDLASQTGSELTNFIHLVGSDKDIALKPDPANPKLLTGEITIPDKTTGFFISLMDTYGLRSKDPAVYRLDVLPDKAPAVRIVLPNRKEVLLVREARHRIVFEATDDFAIGKVTLAYKVDEGELRRTPLDLKGLTPKSFRGEHSWKLTEVQPPSATRPMLEGSVIEYWVEVEDTNNLSGPGWGSSDHYMIRVVSEAEKRAEMAARIADIGSSLRALPEDQEAAAGRLQTILLEKQEPK